MKTVFFDVDTQLDFLFPTGALYVPGAERISPALTALTAFAAENHLPIISSLDTHSEDDPEFKLWKPHCVRGTQGQQKYSGTLLHPASELQILFEKDTIDFFPDLRLHILLDDLQAERFVVYGLVTEYCVRSVAFGLLKRKARVELVTDAIKSLNAAEEHTTLQLLEERGGRLVTLRDVLSSEPA